jgi:hypothetical protein
MEGPEVVPTVRLSGVDGNAYSILGKVSEALREHGADKKYIKKYFEESMAGDYDNLLRVAMKYSNII